MNKEEEGEEEGPKKNIKLGRQVVGRTREEGRKGGESGWWIDRLKSKWGEEIKEKKKDKKEKKKGAKNYVISENSILDVQWRWIPKLKKINKRIEIANCKDWKE